MTSLYEPPVSYAIAVALVLFGAWAVARGARMMSDGLAGASALGLIRGIRLAIFALVAGFFAVGVVSGRAGFITFGAIILAEELYETGVLALFVRLGEREAGGETAGGLAKRGGGQRVPRREDDQSRVRASTSAGRPSSLTTRIARRSAGPRASAESIGPSAWTPKPRAIAAKSGAGSSMRMPTTFRSTGRPRVFATDSWCSSSLPYVRLLHITVSSGSRWCAAV